MLSRLPKVGYLDMGLDSDLAAARARFPDARLGVLYSPWKLREAPDHEIRADMTRIADEAAPCDVIMADIAWDTPDERVKRLIELCREVGESFLERK